MIEAMVNMIDNLLVLNFSYPNGSIVGPITVSELSDAKRLVYFYNRTYILDKLKPWLKQRAYALMLTKCPKLEAEAYRILEHLNRFTKLSFFRLCDWVIDHEESIKAIAPGEKSHHYPYYRDTILPILEFCETMKGVEA